MNTKNKTLTMAEIGLIGETANFFLDAFLRNGEFLGNGLHNPYKTGMILNLFTQGEFCASLHIGKVLYVEDIDYGTKFKKYQHYAYQKCDALVCEPDKMASKGTKKFPVNGGIRVNEWLVGSISGQHEDIDLGLITLIMKKRGYLNSEQLNNIYSRYQIPLLCLKHLGKIIVMEHAKKLLWED